MKLRNQKGIIYLLLPLPSRRDAVARNRCEYRTDTDSQNTMCRSGAVAVLVGQCAKGNLHMTINIYKQVGYKILLHTLPVSDGFRGVHVLHTINNWVYLSWVHVPQPNFFT